jgi:hypothetical protein
MSDSEKKSSPLKNSEPLFDWMKLQFWASVVSIAGVSLLEPDLTLPAAISAVTSHEVLRAMTMVKEDEFDQLFLRKILVLMVLYMGFNFATAHIIDIETTSLEAQAFFAIPILIALAGWLEEAARARKQPST